MHAFAAILLGSIMNGASGSVTAVRCDFLGWNDAWRISNRVVDIVVVPSIGRIMFYGMSEGENVLWVNPALAGTSVSSTAKDWQNFGGDKLWPAPQTAWNWPPPLSLEAGPYVAVRIPGGLRITGPQDPTFKISFRRDILVDGGGTGVRIVNRMTNHGKKAVRLSLWQIAQVDRPDYASLEIRRSKVMPEGFFRYGNLALNPLFHEVRDQELRLRRNPAESRKFGGSAFRGAIGSVRGDVQFRMETRYRPGAEYPDSGSAQQVFLNADPLPYVELELANPLEELPPGGKSEMVVGWTLSSLPTK